MTYFVISPSIDIHSRQDRFRYLQKLINIIRYRLWPELTVSTIYHLPCNISHRYGIIHLSDADIKFAIDTLYICYFFKTRHIN